MSFIYRTRPFSSWSVQPKRAAKVWEDVNAECALEEWAPRVDVLNEDEQIIITADLPGLDRKDIHIRVNKGVLTITGERVFAEEDKREQFARIERHYGAFSRTFHLPDNIDAERIEAKIEQGVLRVVLPKAESAKPREIEVKAAKSK